MASIDSSAPIHGVSTVQRRQAQALAALRITKPCIDNQLMLLYWQFRRADIFGSSTCGVWSPIRMTCPQVSTSLASKTIDVDGP